MPLEIYYPDDPRTAAPMLATSQAVWAVAAQIRRQLNAESATATSSKISAERLMESVDRVVVNGRAFSVAWDAAHPVHDEGGQAVFGVCETDPDTPGQANVSINGPLLAGRPDLIASTAAHELGHVIFDVPAGHRCYQAVTPSAAAFRKSERISEWRANEFMGALLVPAALLHRDLLKFARAERLPFVRRANHGRPGCPIVDASGRPDALAGVLAALAERFEVSDSFIDVRLRRYGLVIGGGEVWS